MRYNQKKDYAMDNIHQDNSQARQNIVKNRRQLVLWIGALVVGAVLGVLGWGWLDTLMNFIATVYTRLFQFLAVPTIVLAVMTTLASIGDQKDTGRIFRHAVTYTLLTTFAAAAVGLVLFLLVRPGNLPAQMVSGGQAAIPKALGGETYYDHILSVVPNNLVQPFLEANVLSLLLIAAAVGIALAKMRQGERRTTVLNLLLGLQDLLFMLIKGLIWTLPLGIMAFAAQLSAQVTAGVAAASLGRYVAVILGGNVLQFFVVLPLFLLARGLNPIRHLGRMMPAVLMAFFTKSSAATLPVTMETAEKRAGVAPKVSRFVLPICTTINMNGCAAFILVTHTADDVAVARHRRDLRHRQCRRADGLLFPHTLADDWARRPRRHHGYHPAHLYHHRHGGDCRECVVGLLRGGHDGQRPPTCYSLRHNKA